MKLTVKKFDELYRQLAPLVFRRAFLGLGDEEDARDCVQSAFLGLWENRDNVENPAAFVNTLVSNNIALHYRSMSMHERFARLYPIEVENGEKIDLLPQEEIRKFVETGLTEAVRRVVECVFFERKSYKEAAEALNISVATVNKHVVTALRQMRQYFKNRLNINLEATDLLGCDRLGDITTGYGDVNSSHLGKWDTRGVSLRVSYTIFNKPIRMNSRSENLEILRRIEKSGDILTERGE